MELDGGRDETNEINYLHIQRNLLRTKATQLNRGWMHFDMKHEVRRWLENPVRNHGIAVSCQSGCRQSEDHPDIALEGDFKPFLLIKTSVRRRRISKRYAYQCVPNVRKQRCCMSQFQVDFNTMEGWDWIIEPRSFTVNYCTGSCYSKLTYY